MCIISIAPTAPPRNVTSTIITSRSITVIWDTITCSERNGIITSYTADFGLIGNTTVIAGIAVRDFTANGLIPFSKYTFRIAGVTVGTGVYSDIILITTAEDSKNTET